MNWAGFYFMFVCGSPTLAHYRYKFYKKYKAASARNEAKLRTSDEK